MIRFEIDARDMRELDRFIEAYPREGKLAARRAINKTLAYVNTHGARAIAQTHGIPLRALRRRRRVALVRAQGSRLSGRIWFGVLPIAASYLGRARQTRRGARAGKHDFPGAFVATMPSGHVGIFKRKPGLSRFTQGRPRTSGANLPIEEQTVPLAGAEAALQGVFARVPERLRTLFLHEVRFLFVGRGR